MSYDNEYFLRESIVRSLAENKEYNNLRLRAIVSVDKGCVSVKEEDTDLECEVLGLQVEIDDLKRELYKLKRQKEEIEEELDDWCDANDALQKENKRLRQQCKNNE